MAFLSIVVNFTISNLKWCLFISFHFEKVGLQSNAKENFFTQLQIWKSNVIVPVSTKYVRIMSNLAALVRVTDARISLIPVDGGFEYIFFFLFAWCERIWIIKKSRSGCHYCYQKCWWIYMVHYYKDIQLLCACVFARTQMYAYVCMCVGNINRGS